MMDTREAVARAIDPRAWLEDEKHNTLGHISRRADSLVYADRAIAAHLKALAASGFVVVPREPTEAMIRDGEWAWMHRDLNDPLSEPIRDAYRAMIQAVDNG